MSESAHLTICLKWLLDGKFFLKNIIEQDPFLEKVVIQWKPMFCKNFILGNGSNFWKIPILQDPISLGNGYWVRPFFQKLLIWMNPFSWKEVIWSNTIFLKRGYYTRLFFRCKCFFGETPCFLESARLLEYQFFEFTYWARPRFYGKRLLRETHFRGNNYSARPNWLFGGKLLLTATLGVIWRNTTLRKMVMEQDPFFAMWLFGETPFLKTM